MSMIQEQSHSLSQQTTLHTALEARQLHSLEFLTASIMELEQKIATEIQMNPVLEAVQPDIYSSEPDLPERLPSTDTDYDENRDDFQDSLDKMLTAESYEQMVVPDIPSDGNADAIRDAQERRQYLFDSLENPAPNLQQYLLDQLRCTPCSKSIRHAAAEIIGSIDETGYLRTAEGDIAQSTSCSLAVVEKALKLVQSFEPPGIGARTPEECLILQLKRKKIPVALYEKLLYDFMITGKRG